MYVCVRICRHPTLNTVAQKFPSTDSMQNVVHNARMSLDQQYNIYNNGSFSVCVCVMYVPHQLML
jgi:hypothetical protein